MVVFQIQSWKSLPETGESKRDKTFLLKTDMKLEVCTSLGKHLPQERCWVKEVRPANDVGWNSLKSRCSRPRKPWKLNFCKSNAGADRWWQRRMVMTSCRDERRVKWVFFLGHHNHQANAPIHQDHVIQRRLFDLGCPGFLRSKLSIW